MKKIIITLVSIIIILVLSYFAVDYYTNQLQKNNENLIKEKTDKILELNSSNSKLKTENNNLKVEISDLKIKIVTLQKRIDYFKSSTIKYLDLITTLKEEISLLKKTNTKRTKKLFYESEEIKGGKNYVSDHEKAKLVSNIKKALKNKKQNEVVIVEGNTDTIRFINDKGNRKNIGLAFKRAINNILYSLSEDELNSIYLKANTKANERNVKVYIM